MVGIFFDQPIRNGTRIHYNIQKVDTGQGDDYSIGCLLDYSYLKKNTSIIDLKVIQQINLTENLERVRNTETFFIIKEVKKNVLKF